MRRPKLFRARKGDGKQSGGRSAVFLHEACRCYRREWRERALSPPGTSDFQHEVELVVAFSGGGSNIPADKVEELIFGYAVGLDMTRRDIQAAAKKKGRPWDMSKAFDFSAPCAAITPKAETGALVKGAIACKVNGKLRQSADLSDMTWKVPQIVQFLSALVEIRPGGSHLHGDARRRRAGRARRHD
ncbi:protein of unknown function [Methylocella tundrae]|uniref:Fumarylacetoacetase-like C-terminal domain-containing protein n=1 Tax=Methylocella tundrae TaxID=227605 RepID=A0A4U8YV30_METTU|nr:protein of unknown function [Methylocella tundrae]